MIYVPILCCSFDAVSHFNRFSSLAFFSRQREIPARCRRFSKAAKRCQDDCRRGRTNQDTVRDCIRHTGPEENHSSCAGCYWRRDFLSRGGRPHERPCRGYFPSNLLGLGGTTRSLQLLPGLPTANESPLPELQIHSGQDPSCTGQTQ